MDRGEVTSLILLDLSAAFDTVNHSIFLTRVQNWFGVDGLSLNWSSSHLSSRSQAVSINDSISASSSSLLYSLLRTWSTPFPFHSLYILYTTRIGLVISKNSLKYHLYADDTQLLQILLYLLKHLPTLSPTFFPGWTWTNCSSIYLKLNFFLLAQNNSVSNFLILQIYLSAMISSQSVPLLAILSSCSIQFNSDICTRQLINITLAGMAKKLQ